MKFSTLFSCCSVLTLLSSCCTLISCNWSSGPQEQNLHHRLLILIYHYSYNSGGREMPIHLHFLSPIVWTFDEMVLYIGMGDLNSL